MVPWARCKAANWPEHDRALPAQKTEAKVACPVLNRMIKPGLPAFQRVG